MVKDQQAFVKFLTFDNLLILFNKLSKEFLSPERFLNFSPAA